MGRKRRLKMSYKLEFQGEKGVLPALLAVLGLLAALLATALGGAWNAW